MFAFIVNSEFAFIDILGSEEVIIDKDGRAALHYELGTGIYSTQHNYSLRSA